MKGKEINRTWVLSSHGGEYEDYTDIVTNLLEELTASIFPIEV
jgi:hypothetical protein